MTEEADAFLERLATGARRASPDAPVEVERERTLRERLSGQQGRAVAITIDGTDRRLHAAGTIAADGRARSPGWSAGSSSPVSASRSVPGSTRSPRRWRHRPRDRPATRPRPGVRTPCSGSSRPPPRSPSTGTTWRAGWTACGTEARKRLPEDAVATVERIVGLLQTALPRASGDAAALVTRTATVYLPDTLRAYVALPADWARSGALRDGSSAEDALRAQLASLEDAATRMRDAAVADDADALLLNGLFLEQRFEV